MKTFFRYLSLTIILAGFLFGVAVSAFNAVDFWTGRIHVEFVLLILIISVVANFILIKFFARPLSRIQSVFNSIAVIVVNFVTVFLFLHSIDGLDFYFFGNSSDMGTISDPISTPLVFYMAPFLFLFPILFALIYKGISIFLKNRQKLFSPYYVVYVHSLLLIPVYMLNWNFFYDLFNFDGRFSRVYDGALTILFFLTLAISLVITYLLKRSSPSKSNISKQ